MLFRFCAVDDRIFFRKVRKIQPLPLIEETSVQLPSVGKGTEFDLQCRNTLEISVGCIILFRGGLIDQRLFRHPPVPFSEEHDHVRPRMFDLVQTDGKDLPRSLFAFQFCCVHAPAKIYKINVLLMLCRLCRHIRQHDLGQSITLGLHVTKCTGDKY